MFINAIPPKTDKFAGLDLDLRRVADNIHFLSAFIPERTNERTNNPGETQF